MQHIDPISVQHVIFKYDLKMSTVNRETLKAEEQDAVKKYFLETDSDYSEIIESGFENKLKCGLRETVVERGTLRTQGRMQLWEVEDLRNCECPQVLGSRRSFHWLLP